MDYRIEHELPCRIRLRFAPQDLRGSRGPVLAAVLETQDGVKRAAASSRTGSLLIFHDGSHRDSILKAVSLIERSELDEMDIQVEPVEPPLKVQVAKLLSAAMTRRMLPMPIRIVVTTAFACAYFFRGIRELLHLRLGVETLDAAALGVSLARQDYNTASTVMTLLALGNLIEDWTKKRSQASLAESLAVRLNSVWVQNDDGSQREISMSELAVGDRVIVRAGGLIPADGVVTAGEALVNQASMTGESMAVHRWPGTSVYAGTALEAGELTVQVRALADESRLSQIAKLIEESEELKASVQCRAERMADGLVPWSFGLAGMMYALTGNATRASAALMVDYSCAIKLATPLSILSAMREGVRRGVIIKGGKFLEALSEADTVVFDKTGTLTVSQPRVIEVVPFEGWQRSEILRLSACLEEHFPHSVATAVVRQAELEGLTHREEHAKVEYVVAHGVVSRYLDKRVIIGSRHFVAEDEGVVFDEEQKKVIEEKEQLGSLLYLAFDSRLIGLLVIDDPLREEAADVVAQLRSLGIRHVVMLTGDHPKTAARVAKQLGLDDYRAEMLPDEKTRFVQSLRKQGRKVIMVGDGINDAPSLAAANVGVSLRGAADVAQQVADVVLAGDLSSLPDARRLSELVMRRIERSYLTIVGLNTTFLLLGLLGIITPAVGALLHNSVTIGTSMTSVRPLLDKLPASLQAVSEESE
ncbi:MULTISPECIES: heavy metal translocating P-type ATPase [Jonquetella]|uniref:Heavy metal translocating P-type ATPase n=1 Tax=Jonquetella anthropi DSM 22815 TaxID=885272 RepID=H0UJM8_9BACT|nr:MULTISPECIES: heavy metal translocating P-type ATPase [Jonquetella]EHM12896.1 heavy metal translocating P-type ATPase [Jonquetella anthropi DSM 22815]ERL24119.1 heavy metal translocating P-type ATPase [Jonquetella sp. BV3C21]